MLVYTLKQGTEALGQTREKLTKNAQGKTLELSLKTDETIWHRREREHSLNTQKGERTMRHRCHKLGQGGNHTGGKLDRKGE